MGDGKFDDEVNSRLGEFFSEPLKASAPQNGAGGGNSTYAQFTELKAIILSIEWEITNDILNQLLDETNRLQGQYPNNQILLSFLKLLESVGKYISSKKANAHPDSIRLLHSIHKNLEDVLTSDALTEVDIKTILSGEVKKFKALRQQLLDQKSQSKAAAKKKSPAPKKAPAKKPERDIKPLTSEEPVEEEIDLDGNNWEKSPPKVAANRKPSGPSSSMPPPSQTILKLEELKAFMEKEFKKLREEIKSLKK